MSVQDFSATALFCDTIRDEVGGTVTIVGVLNDNITVPFTPGALARLCVYVRISFDPFKSPKRLSISLQFSDDPVLFESFVETDLLEKAFADAVSNGAALATLVTRIETAPFPVASPGILRVLIKRDQITQTIGTLKIDVETRQ